MGKSKKDQGYRVAVSGAKGFLKILVYICIAFAVIYLARTAYTFGYAIFNQEPMDSKDGKEVTVVIPENTSVYEIGKILKDKGLIEDPRIFFVQEKLSRYKGKLKAGTFILSTEQTADDMMEILSGENTEGQPDPEAEESTTSGEVQENTTVFDSVDQSGEEQ